MSTNIEKRLKLITEILERLQLESLKGTPIIVEVKKRGATPADAHQLKRYVEYFEEVEKRKVKGILVAKSFSSKVMNVLTANNLEAVEVPWQEIFPSLANEKPKVTMDDYIKEE